MPPKGAPKAASKTTRAAPKPRKAGKAAAAVPAAPAAPTDSTDLADHAPLDSPVTPLPRPQARAGRLRFETPGEQFPPVSPGSSDSDIDVAVTEDVFAPPVLISPIKRRQRRAAPAINRLTDLEVWDMTDQEIIGMHIL